MASKANPLTTNKAKIRKKCGHYRCTGAGGVEKNVEFISNVKITLVESPVWVYRQTMWTTGIITAAYFAMGGCIIYMLLYAVFYARVFKTLNLHIALFTLSFEFFLKLSFLFLNKLNITSVYLTSNEMRAFSEVLLILANTVSIIALFEMVFISKNRIAAFTWHSFHGWIACLTLILRLFVNKHKDLKQKKWLKPTMLYLVVLFGTLCFGEALFKFKFKRYTGFKWSGYLLYAFCLYYTIVAIYKSLKNYVDPEVEEIPTPIDTGDDDYCTTCNEYLDEQFLSKIEEEENQNKVEAPVIEMEQRKSIFNRKGKQSLKN